MATDGKTNGKTYKPNPNQIGSLWVNKSKKGLEMLSGDLVIDGKTISVVAFQKEVNTKNGTKSVWDVLLKQNQE